MLQTSSAAISKFYDGHYDEAYELAEQLEPHQAVVLRSLILRRQTRYEDCLALVQRFNRDNRSNVDDFHKGRLAAIEGLCYGMLGDLKPAANLFMVSRSYALGISNDWLLLELLQHEGRIALYRGDIERLRLICNRTSGKGTLRQRILSNELSGFIQAADGNADGLANVFPLNFTLQQQEKANDRYLRAATLSSWIATSLSSLTNETPSLSKFYRLAEDMEWTYTLNSQRTVAYAYLATIASEVGQHAVARYCRDRSFESATEANALFDALAISLQISDLDDDRARVQSDLRKIESLLNAKEFERGDIMWFLLLFGVVMVVDSFPLLCWQIYNAIIGRARPILMKSYSLKCDAIILGTRGLLNLAAGDIESGVADCRLAFDFFSSHRIDAVPYALALQRVEPQPKYSSYLARNATDFPNGATSKLLLRAARRGNAATI